MEKNYWMYLFFFSLPLCVVLTMFLVQSNREASYKKKYETLKEMSDRDKKRHDALKQAYAKLATSQVAILERMMLEPKILKKYAPAYEEIEDNDVLSRKVRKDIGLLEAEKELLNKFGELSTGTEKPGKETTAQEPKKIEEATPAK